MTPGEQLETEAARSPTGRRAFQRGLDGRDLAIGVLSVTATILLAAVVMAQAFRPQQASASGQSGRAGRYVVASAMLDATADLLIVFDTQTELVNVYNFNLLAGQTEFVQQLDMADLTENRLQLREELRKLRDQGRRPGQRGLPAPRE